MSKYSPLRSFLESQDPEADGIQLTFTEIEELLGDELPASKRYPAWWSNNPSNNPMTKEWLAAGFRTEDVDIPGERLVFRRRTRSPRRGEVARRGSRPPGRHPAFGCMKGLITFEDGYDVTRPTDELWSEDPGVAEEQ